MTTTEELKSRYYDLQAYAKTTRRNADDARDEWHKQACAEFLATFTGTIGVTPVVITGRSTSSTYVVTGAVMSWGDNPNFTLARVNKDHLQMVTHRKNQQLRAARTKEKTHAAISPDVRILRPDRRCGAGVCNGGPQ